jgi:hypothetical protein
MGKNGVNMWELYFEKGIQLGPKKDGFIESDSILVQMFAINQVATWKENERSGNLEIKTSLTLAY